MEKPDKNGRDHKLDEGAKIDMNRHNTIIILYDSPWQAFDHARTNVKLESGETKRLYAFTSPGKIAAARDEGCHEVLFNEPDEETKQAHEQFCKLLELDEGLANASREQFHAEISEFLIDNS